jgi:hypothetical protein
VMVLDFPLVQREDHCAAETDRSYSAPPCALWEPRRRWYHPLLALTSRTQMRGCGRTQSFY